MRWLCVLACSCVTAHPLGTALPLEGSHPHPHGLHALLLLQFDAQIHVRADAAVGCVNTSALRVSASHTSKHGSKHKPIGTKPTQIANSVPGLTVRSRQILDTCIFVAHCVQGGTGWGGTNSSFGTNAKTGDDAQNSNRLGVFTAHCLATTFLVLLVCADDPLWLLPFVQGADKGCKLGAYIIAMAFMWFCALCLYGAADTAETQWPALPVEVITDVLSTILLMGLTIKFFLEWYRDGDEDEAEDDGCVVEEHDITGACASQSFAHAVPEQSGNTAREDVALASGKSSIDDDEAKGITRYRTLSYSNIFIVSFAGTVSNVGMYVPLMVAQTFSPVELLIGDVIAAIIIALITLGLSQLRVLTQLLSRVPFWIIIGTGATLVCMQTVLVVLSGEDE